MNHKAQAKKFIALCERNGAMVDWNIAGTGTVYVKVSSEEGNITVRFSDHGSCYGSEHISVDRDGHTYLQALTATQRRTGINLSRAIAANSRKPREVKTPTVDWAAFYAMPKAEQKSYLISLGIKV